MNKIMLLAVWAAAPGVLFAAVKPAEMNGMKAADVKEAISADAPVSSPQQAAAPGSVMGSREADRGLSKNYSNSEGCRVEAEESAYGYRFYVRAGDGQQAVVGYLKNLKSGDIASFCGNAAVSGNAAGLAITCGEQSEAGAYATRGRAELEFKGDLSAVRVTGEVKKTLGWKVDTRINCGNLKAEGRSSPRALPVGYSRLIKDADRRSFEQVYSKHNRDFYNIGHQLVGAKIDQAAFFVDHATEQGNAMVYIVSITKNDVAIGKFRVDANISTGKVEYSLAGD